MKAKYISEACWKCRLAPYVLALGVLGFGVSLLWIRPLLGYLGLGLASGALLSLFHMMKWRTGREGFQIAAMAVTLVPLFVLMDARLGPGPVCQYLAVFLSVYAGAIVALRYRISAWSQS